MAQADAAGSCDRGRSTFPVLRASAIHKTFRTKDVFMSPGEFKHREHKAFAVVLIGVCAVFAGCQMNTPPSGRNEPGEHKANGKRSPAVKTPRESRSPRVTKDDDGRKFLDGIPYDVWFDDPLAVAANSAVVTTPIETGVASPTKNTSAAPTPTEVKPEPAVSAPAGGDDWSAYISMDQLLEESKKIRNQLKGLLQTQAAYNENFEVIKMDGAVMAALAGIVAQAGDGVNWKEKAPYIRDYGWELVDSAKGLGKPNYEKTNTAYENMQSVFDGSIPAGAAEPASSRPFPEVAPRYYLMKRMKLAFNALKLNINTQEKLKSEQDMALHEAMILAALTKVVSLKDYGSADEPEYQQFMQEILQQCQAAMASIKEDEFSRFSEALNVIDKACLNCHSQYKE